MKFRTFGLLAVTALLFAGTAFAQEGGAYLGVSVSPTDGAVQVLTVRPDSAAQAAGLKDSDLLLSMDGKKLDSVEALISSLGSKKPGDRIVVEIRRGDETLKKEITLGARSADPVASLPTMRRPTPPAPVRPPVSSLSLPEVAIEVEPGQRGTLGVLLEEGEAGPRITEALGGGPAAAAGLAGGDIIQALGDRKIDSIETLQDALGSHKPGDTIGVIVQRGDKRERFPVRLANAATLQRLVDAQEQAPQLTAEFMEEEIEPIEEEPEEVIQWDATDLVLPRTASESEELEDRAYLGVMLEDGDGVHVADILAGSPAAASGLKDGDKIITIGKAKVDSIADVQEALRGHKAGSKTWVTMQRGDRKDRVQIQLASAGQIEELMSEGGISTSVEVPTAEAWVELTDVTEDPIIADFTSGEENQPGWLGVFIEDSDNGVSVSSTVDGSPAAKSGVRAGDKIVSVNRQPVANTEQLIQTLSGEGAGSEVWIGLNRGDRQLTVKATLAARPQENIATFLAEDAPATAAGTITFTTPHGTEASSHEHAEEAHEGEHGHDAIETEIIELNGPVRLGGRVGKRPSNLGDRIKKVFQFQKQADGDDHGHEHGGDEVEEERVFVDDEGREIHIRIRRSGDSENIEVHADARAENSHGDKGHGHDDDEGHGHDDDRRHSMDADHRRSLAEKKKALQAAKRAMKKAARNAEKKARKEAKKALAKAKKAKSKKAKSKKAKSKKAKSKKAKSKKAKSKKSKATTTFDWLRDDGDHDIIYKDDMIFIVPRGFSGAMPHPPHGGAKASGNFWVERSAPEKSSNGCGGCCCCCCCKKNNSSNDQGEHRTITVTGRRRAEAPNAHGGGSGGMVIKRKKAGSTD